MDVVEKLRNRATNWSEPNGADSILDLEAAEEIVRLRKGIREIGEYLDVAPSRVGDASRTCVALLTC